MEQDLRDDERVNWQRKYWELKEKETEWSGMEGQMRDTRYIREVHGAGERTWGRG
jgi:hypothetical protein